MGLPNQTAYDLREDSHNSELESSLSSEEGITPLGYYNCTLLLLQYLIRYVIMHALINSI